MTHVVTLLCWWWRLYCSGCGAVDETQILKTKKVKTQRLFSYQQLVSLEYLSVYWNTQVAPSGFNESSTDWKVSSVF